jgi:hypothetical protein
MYGVPQFCEGIDALSPLVDILAASVRGGLQTLVD